MPPETALGRIQVSPKAIASIASKAVLSCYGVVGMSAATLRDGLAEILHTENLHRGVDVHVDEGHIAIDLYVVIEYGIRISEVAQNVMSSVKFAVEKALSMPVSDVNIHVQGVRVSLES